MSEPCGCCAGVETATPVPEVNPPGLSALRYRVGTYATFYESMLARLSNLPITLPSKDGTSTNPIYPLKAFNYLLLEGRPLIWVDGKTRYDTNLELHNCDDVVHVTESGMYYSKKLITPSMPNNQLAAMNTAYKPTGFQFRLIATTWNANNSWATGTDTTMQATIRQAQAK